MSQRRGMTISQASGVTVPAACQYTERRSSGGRSAQWNRRDFLALLGGAAGCACCAGARAARLDYRLAATEIASGTWAVHGRSEYFSFDNGGNIVNVGFVEVPDGVVVIDTGPSRRYGEALNALIAELVPGKPVLRVYNTHHHPDHFLGNQSFDTAVIATAQPVIDNIAMEGGGFTDNMYRLVGDWMRGTEPVLPGVVLTADEEEIGGRKFSLHYLSGHTSADLVIRDQQTGVVFSGDLAFLFRAPTTPHADIATWLSSIETLSSLDKDLILPGHGPIDHTEESLRQTADYLDWLDQAVRQAIQRGWTMNEAMAIEIPRRFHVLEVLSSEFERSIVHLYLQYEELLMPQLDAK